MKILTYAERRYIFTDKDRKLVLDAMSHVYPRSWISEQMGFKSYVTWYRKFTNYRNKGFFYEMEVEKLEKLLFIKFDRD